MYPEIRSFAILSGSKIFVEFTSGDSGIFDMTPYLKSNFFSALKKEDYFKKAHLEFGVITWPNGQDISPATIRIEMQPAECPKGVELRTVNVHTLA